MEWVGYGVEKKVVFAQLAYPILADEDSSSMKDGPSSMPSKYMIYLREDDYEGKEVPSSQLFKFIDESSGHESLQASSSVNFIDGHQTAGGVLTARGGLTEKDSSSTSSMPSKYSREVARCRARTETKPKPNRKEGSRYIKQAQRDCDVADLIVTHDQKTLHSNTVCFLSHQVAEKALEGLVLGRCGEDCRTKTGWHKLQQRIKSLFAPQWKMEKKNMQELTESVKILDNYYLQTRYPNQWEGHDDIPADHYTKEEAKIALSNAKLVLQIQYCTNGQLQ